MKRISGLLDEALALKALPRAGWLRAGVPDPESVAAHSWGVAWLALCLCPPELDQRRLLSLALVHDLAEVRVGDLTPHDGVPEAQKRQAERASAAAMMADRPDLIGLFNEALSGQSPEARFLRELDRLDMALQAVRYQRQTGVDTSEFIESARRVILHPHLLAILTEAEARLRDTAPPPV